jgi:UDP-N-acetyl-D-glucosamine dehydrogenase
MSVATPAKSDGGEAERLAAKIQSLSARVCIVGLGYVGLPLAQTFVRAGYAVLGFDIDAEKVSKLMLGQSYIGHIASEQVEQMVGTGRFEATADAARFAEADAIIICVPTPLTEAREPDLSYIVKTGEAISRHLRAGQLIVLESTTYPGTTDELLQPILEQSGLRVGRELFLAFSPEREDPGNPNFSTPTIPKIVGGIDDTSGRLAVSLYAPVVSKVVPVSRARVAEAAKILENTYRAVNIALVNELKVVFDAMGIDVWEVIAAAKTKPFGFQAFYPGPGLGGHCIPIDPFYLTWAARKYGHITRFIELAGEVNQAMPKHIVRRVAEALNEDSKSLKGSKICVLGVAYKKDVDDPRESPAFEIIEQLEKSGAKVSYSDPYVPKAPEMRRHDIHLVSETLTDAFLKGLDCALIVTDHSCVDYGRVVRLTRLVVDTRNATANLPPGGGRVVKA